MARSNPTTPDLAGDAAGLLRRFGFAVLVILAPIAAIVSRRGLVILVPIGIALLVLATFIDSEGREPLGRARRAMIGPAGLTAAFLAFWAGLSLLWTPFPAAASERLLNLAGIAAVGMLAVAALPQRMRVTNLYLMPIGTGLAALVALVLEARGVPLGDAEPTTDMAILDRGLLLLVLVAPSAISWLASKDRYMSCFALVAVVTAALVYGGAWPALAAFAIGAVVYAIATLDGGIGRWVGLVVMPGLVLAAPLVPFLLRPMAKLVFGISHPRVESIRVWARIVTDDPARLITGHGLDTVLRAKIAGLVPNLAPTGILFEVWFELGFLGAIALALLLAFAVNGASRLQGGAAPGAMMTLAVAFSLAVMGQGAAQAWWLIGLALAALVAVAVDRGQYRTTRPRPSGPAT
jgi:hypothetical protein